MNGLEFVFFGICAVATIAGALLTVLAQNPIRSAMSLLLAIGGITGFFISLSAQFLAAIELIVYAGAIVVLFVFVIMLIGPDATPPRDSKAAFWRYLAAGVFGLFSLVTGVLALRASGAPHPLPPLRIELGTIDTFGRELYTRGLVPFELATALFVVAVVGAIAVARGRHRAELPKSEAPKSAGREAA
jgi:NADH-quinone oxidoreductase subunit J